MPLIEESFDSLPYIDVDPSQIERAKVDELISAELPSEYQSSLHPSIPPLPATRISPLIQQETDRIAANIPTSCGVDLSRYEAPESPLNDSDTEAWRSTIQKTYVSSSYLSSRLTNLSLLEDFGKNAWLIGNSQLEDILQDLEKELAELKQATEVVNKARKAAQEGSKAEMVSLEETWKRGVGRIIEVQVATEGLRHEILERRRRNAR